MRCANCGHQNPAGSVFCQQCGTRVVGAATPAGTAPGVACGRCGGENQPRMRFCVHCGNGLQGGSPQPEQPASAATPHAVGANPPVSVGMVPTPVQVAKVPPNHAPAGSVCWRCQGAGDPGSDYCKFCGARYADAPGQRPAVPAEEPRAAYSTLAEPHARQGPKLVSIRKDGSDGQTFAVHGEQTDIGREEGDVVLADDPYLSPRHARVRRRGREFFLRDLDSVNGVYVRLQEAVEISHGDRVLIGQQVLCFEMLDDAELPLGPVRTHGVMAFGTPGVPRFGRLVQYTTEGVGRDVYYLYRDETVLGRENGDIVFTDDPFLSRRHASITVERATKRVLLKDLGSSNGTSVRLRGERVLRGGDQFRVGRHLFRFDNPNVADGR